MASTFIFGILAAFLATTLATAWRRAPTRKRCPECGSATVAVHPELRLLKRMADVRLRWCQACSWQGWGRHGPEWIPGQPTAHDSGFFWGEDPVADDVGFQFADQPAHDTHAEPPHHPSGFRFGEPAPRPRRAHPSGFAWADGRRALPPRRGFTWKDAV
jgi:hypothetical protein